MGMPAEPANVLHCGGSSPSVACSTINAGEAIPGVVTTLTWSFFGDRTERGLRGSFSWPANSASPV